MVFLGAESYTLRIRYSQSVGGTERLKRHLIRLSSALSAASAVDFLKSAPYGFSFIISDRDT